MVKCDTVGVKEDCLSEGVEVEDAVEGDDASVV